MYCPPLPGVPLHLLKSNLIRPPPHSFQQSHRLFYLFPTSPTQIQLTSFVYIFHILLSTHTHRYNSRTVSLHSLYHHPIPSYNPCVLLYHIVQPIMASSLQPSYLHRYRIVSYRIIYILINISLHSYPHTRTVTLACY